MNISPVSSATTSSSTSPQGAPVVQASSRTDSSPTANPGVTTDMPVVNKAVGVDQNTLKSSVDTINNYLKSFDNNSIEFSIDTASSKVVVKLVDTQTQTVLMQTPSKEALAIAQALDRTQGLLIQTKA